MASKLIAGNATNSGIQFNGDNTGTLEIVTGSGAGTTALTIDASQNATFAGNISSSAGTLNISGAVSAGSLTVASVPVIGLNQGNALSYASFTGAGTVGTTTITASAVSGVIGVGQILSGTGIAAGATVTAVNGATITLSLANTGAVSGTISVVGFDFVGIPSTAKRITVLLQGLSTNGSSTQIIQLGTNSGVENTGYLGTGSGLQTTVAATLYTAGFGLNNLQTAAMITHGAIMIHSFGSNAWVAAGVLGNSDTGRSEFTGGSKVLSGTLDRIRFTTVNGTDAFDAGSVNIMWE